MGTFHHDKGELHGITVAVDTTGAEIWIGRCDVMTDEHIVLLDADVHSDGDDNRSKAEYLKRAAMVGIWKKHDRVVLPLRDVHSVERLGEI
jgi:hypothetical protein